MPNLRIGQKITIVLVVILLLFTAGLYSVIVTTSSDNLSHIKLEELGRMARILAGRVGEMIENGEQTVQTFERSEPIVNQIHLLTYLGPYYADPGAYFGEDFMRPGTPIDAADQIYVLQAQLNLIQLLRDAQRINNLSSIAFYMISPFDVAPDAEPVLSFKMNMDDIIIAQYTEKTNPQARTLYRIPVENFSFPSSGYFDVSTAYSAPPAQFFEELGFEPVPVEEDFTIEPFDQIWEGLERPRSVILMKAGVPMIRSWYPIRITVAAPETWQEESVPVGIAVVDQQLDQAIIDRLQSRLDVHVGFAQQDILLNSSLDLAERAALTNERVTLEGQMYFFKQETISLSGATGANLQAVALSPVGELEMLTERLRTQLGVTTLVVGLVVIGVVYFSIQRLVSRPLEQMTDRVQQISSGDLDQQVPVRSQDELGQLAMAFNSMAAQLRESFASLERRVAERTEDLERRAQELRAAAEVGRAATTLRDLDTLLSRVTYLISEQFGFYHVGVFLLDESGNYAVLRAANSTGGQQMLEHGHRLQVGAQGIVGYVTREGKPRIALDVGEDAVHFKNPYLPDTHSEMALPLMAGDEMLGALDVQSVETEAFTEEDIAVLRLVADQLAIAIENANLLSEAQEALAAQRRAYGEVSREAWQELVASQALAGYTCDAHDNIVPVATAWPAEMKHAGRRGEMVQTEDGTVMIPVQIRDQTLGVVRLRKSETQPAWTAEQLELMQSLTNQLEVALESARLYQDSQWRAAREQLVGEITAHIRESLEIDTVLKTAVQEMRRALAVPELTIRLANEPGAGEGEKNGGAA
ncbi:MAG: GAF domain-containing protein [Anaerolineales bacterium]